MQPTLVFLHGLLGTKSDWQQLIEKLPHFSCLALDLPFHGDAAQVEVEDFEQTCAYLQNQIHHHLGDKPYILVGYSLGGRIALYYGLEAKIDKSNLRGLILEGANLGLSTIDEKQQRWENDLIWAERFQFQPLSSVLEQWYQQPVFSHLNREQRQFLIEKRSVHSGKNIARMLLATSLALQQNFSEKVRSILLPIHYICGEKDQKFRQMALGSQLNFSLISQAGHNAHLENPQEYAQKLGQLLQNSFASNP